MLCSLSERVNLTYTLFLKNYQADFSIGIHDFEKAARQRLIINIELVVNKTTFNDDIENVLNYDFLVAELDKLRLQQHFNLQETLCEKMIDICKTNPQLIAMKITTEKPDVYPNCESVGCAMSWKR